jgi:hypothetical protein
VVKYITSAASDASFMPVQAIPLPIVAAGMRFVWDEGGLHCGRYLVNICASPRDDGEPTVCRWELRVGCDWRASIRGYICYFRRLSQPAKLDLDGLPEWLTTRPGSRRPKDRFANANKQRSRTARAQVRFARGQDPPPPGFTTTEPVSPAFAVPSRRQTTCKRGSPQYRLTWPDVSANHRCVPQEQVHDMKESSKPRRRTDVF